MVSFRRLYMNMPKIILVFLLINVFFTSNAASAPNVTPAEDIKYEIKHLAITVNPLTWFSLGFDVQADIRLGSMFSAQILASYENDDFNIPYNEFTWAGIGAGIRYYWEGRAVNGWYVGPFFSYNFVTAVLTKYDSVDVTYEIKASIKTINFGGFFGYQTIWDNGITLDIGIGMNITAIPDIKYEGENPAGEAEKWTQPGETPIDFIVQIGIGYAF